MMIIFLFISCAQLATLSCAKIYEKQPSNIRFFDVLSSQAHDVKVMGDDDFYGGSDDTNDAPQDDFDDDWSMIQADDDFKSAVLPGDVRYFNLPGYVYFEIFDGYQCNAEPVIIMGIQSGICMPQGSSSSILVTLADAQQCAGLRVQTFHGTNCESENFLASSKLSTFSECHSFSDLIFASPMSYHGRCSSGISERLPIFHSQQFSVSRCGTLRTFILN